MRVVFVLEEEGSVPSAAALGEVFELLGRRGFQVRSEVFEQLLVRPELLVAEGDLYVLHSHHPVALSLAGILSRQGVRILNPYPSCAWTFDRLEAMQRLHSAGVAVPRTWTTSDPAFVRGLLERTPLVARPVRACDGSEWRPVTDSSSIEGWLRESEPQLFQERLGGEVDRFRANVVGGQVFLHRVSAEGRLLPCRASVEIYDLAHHCGQALALYMYSVDMVGTRGGFYVTGVDYVPDYRSPGLAEPVADCVQQYFRRFHPERGSGRKKLDLQEVREASVDRVPST